LAAELQQRQVLRNTTLSELKAFQEALGLRQEDADAIARRLMPSAPPDPEPLPQDIGAAIQPLMSAPEDRSRLENNRETRSRKTMWVMAAVVGLALVAGAGVRILSPSSDSSVSSLAPIESPAVAPEAIESPDLSLDPSPDPSPIDASPIPDPVASPVLPAVWVIVVSSDKTLELAQEQVEIAAEAGLSTVITKRNEWYAVQIGEEFASKAAAEKQRDYVLTLVPGWKKNKPFVQNQTDWCWQPVEQSGYVECQTKPASRDNPTPQDDDKK
jgi:SPOR domain